MWSSDLSPLQVLVSQSRVTLSVCSDVLALFSGLVKQSKAGARQGLGMKLRMSFSEHPSFLFFFS